MKFTGRFLYSGRKWPKNAHCTTLLERGQLVTSYKSGVPSYWDRDSDEQCTGLAVQWIPRPSGTTITNSRTQNLWLILAEMAILRHPSQRKMCNWYELCAPEALRGFILMSQSTADSY
ncbi:hypothetical protein ANN_09976 [Periplaneta americana]|uniref:Uncharacterized protein n=1 Tax=Periplaneta americana TaxID=6978 RepID=A0ABQ8TPA5_PERAM|nr:hypothetical protein ANN_09976 [Periplaneta americana]